MRPRELTDQQITRILTFPRGVKIAEIAFRCGCSIRQVSHIRSGKHRRALRIGTKLGVFPRSPYCTAYTDGGATVVRRLDEVPGKLVW